MTCLREEAPNSATGETLVTISNARPAVPGRTKTSPRALRWFPIKQVKRLRCQELLKRRSRQPSGGAPSGGSLGGAMPEVRN